MIQKITSAKTNPSFRGTTIVKGEGGGNYTSVVLNAADNTRPYGYANSRMNGYTLIVVDKSFEKIEQEYLAFLRKQGKEYVNTTQILNYRMLSLPKLIQKVHSIAKVMGL